MSDVVIRAEALSKQYRIGRQERYRALRDTLTDALYAPARKIRSAFQPANGRNGHGPNGNDTIWALKDVSFEVKRGEVVGIIGRNGAGKSTLLKILSRITRPTTGRAEIHGRVGSLLEVGTGFHPELTGRENIYLNGAILGMWRAEIERKFDEIVAFAEVEKFIDTPVKHFSSGMYMRLAFSVAAHLDPEILLIDEVLAVGDAEFQKKCLGKMGDVASEGRTVLFVSHNLAAIQLLCSRAIYLDTGQIAGIGNTQQLIADYLFYFKSRLGEKLDHDIQLGAKVRLLEFGFSPSPITSGQAADFLMELSASERTHITELAVLIYDSLNLRVGILDLRLQDGPYTINKNETLKIGTRIVRVPLVEGEYRIGLWIGSDDIAKDFYDLIRLDVTAVAPDRGIVPVAKMWRGVIEFDYVVHQLN